MRLSDGYLVLLIAGTLIVAAAVSKLISNAFGLLACRLLRRRGATPDDSEHRSTIVRELRNPVALAMTIGLWQLVLAFLTLSADTRQTLHEVARAAFVLPLVWLALKLVDIVSRLLVRRTKLFAEHEVSRALLPLARRIVKIVIAAVAVVAVLGSLGYSVTGLIAGLGITGIAVALAAQKTLENVLGAFALGIDQPLREGDFVRVGDTIGTVERIGMRSTRFRTLDRTLIAYPNGKLADAVIERYSARDRMRFDVHFRLSLATTSRQLRDIRARIEQLLADHPDRAPSQPPSVHLTGPGDAWFDLEAMAWFQTDDWPAFQVVRDQLLLDCLDIIAAAGAYLNGAPPPPPPAPPARERPRTQA